MSYVDKIERGINNLSNICIATKKEDTVTPLMIAENMLHRTYDQLTPDSTFMNPCSKNGVLEFTWLKMMLQKFGDNEENFHKFYQQITFGIWGDQNDSTTSVKTTMISRLILGLQLDTKENLLNGNKFFYSDSIEQLRRNINSQYAFIAMQPPFKESLNMKIINELTPLTENLIVVHPSTWCMDRRLKNKGYKKFRDSIDRKVPSIDMFNGNPLFNIGLFVPTMITHINNKHNGNCAVNYFNHKFEVESVYDITKYGSNWKPIVEPFMNKMISLDNIWDKRYHSRIEKKDKFYCQLAAISGNWTKEKSKITKDNFYTMIMKNSDGNKGVRMKDKRDDRWLVWEFDTENERDNFINYLKTDFARFLLSIYKVSGDVGYGIMSLIPWLDLTESWNDEKLYKHFEIDNETQEYIKEFLPDFHGIRK